MRTKLLKLSVGIAMTPVYAGRVRVAKSVKHNFTFECASRMGIGHVTVPDEAFNLCPLISTK